MLYFVSYHFILQLVFSTIYNRAFLQKQLTTLAAIAKSFGSRQFQSVVKQWLVGMLIKKQFPPRPFLTKQGQTFLSRCQTTLSSELFGLQFKAKSCLGTRMVMIDLCGDVTDRRCNDVLQMFETFFFELDIIYEGYYYTHIDL